ncbi:unnamed protein product [Phyllotreta striolata]|uniref:Major facilitator superfamily (MFS) profile domain-containing protein n=1 Tax=Phyllotreta striolata TaxID=444603 RepID=A0A9N9TLP7_PHYSR|nr:unnamed protein product [Phyllotreta striolata]
METRRSHTRTYLSCISVNLMAFIAGIGYSWSSPCIPKLKSPLPDNPLGRPLTLQQTTWITSLHALGSLAGPLFTGFTSNRIGKKKTLLVFSAPQILSSIITIFADRAEHLYLARFLLGIGTGCVFSVIPAYVGEVSEPGARGRTSMINSVMLTTGQTLVLTIGPFVSIRAIAVVTLVASIVFLVSFGWFVPESPYHYVLHGRVDKAGSTLKKWRATGSTEKELIDIVEICDESKQERTIGGVLSSKLLRRCLIIALGLVSLQSLVGNPAIVAYQQSILDGSNEVIPGDTAVIVISILQLVGTYWSTGLVDKWGRKQLLYVSYIGLLVSLIVLGGYFILIDYEVDMSGYFFVPFVSVLGYIVFYKIGAGPLPWTLCGEIFPPSFKPHLSTLTALVMTAVNFLVTLVFPYSQMALGLGWTFAVFAGFSLFSLLYIKLAVPETRGKSLIEIQRILLEDRADVGNKNAPQEADGLV